MHPHLYSSPVPATACRRQAGTSRVAQSARQLIKRTKKVEDTAIDAASRGYASPGKLGTFYPGEQQRCILNKSISWFAKVMVNKPGAGICRYSTTLRHIL